jgi:hypothetical protein
MHFSATGFTGFEPPGLGFEFCWGFDWGVTAAYTAAGSAMKRARTERRMAVGILECCKMLLFRLAVLQALLIDFYRIMFILRQ